MPTPRTRKTRRKKAPRRVLALPDLEHAKAAVLNSLTSISGQRTYDQAITEFVTWYCSEPRLAFNRTVVLRYRIHLEQRQYAPTTINLRLAAVRRGGGHHARDSLPGDQQSRPGMGQRPVAESAVGRSPGGRCSCRYRETGPARPPSYLCSIVPSGWR